ncbi:MAG: MFS transporter [Lachnospiraceae bacterium]|nr:MFS transporter [Lachnospiraceae bacterium]
MKLEMSKTKRILALLAILFSNVCVMADLVITPVIGQIYGYYPENMNAVNYIVSGPMIVLVIASLATPLLFKRIDKKIVFMIGSAVFAIGAVFGAFNDNVYYVCVMRTLVGVGEGMVNVVGIAYISDLYESQKDRARINGFYSAAMSFAGMVFSYFGGILGQAGWLNTFKIYYVTAIPMLVLVILFVPSVKAGSGETVKNRDSGMKKEKLGWKFWEMSGCFFVMNIALGATVLYYISSYVMETGIGDSVTAGYSGTLKSLLGFLLGIAFGWIVGKLKRFTITLAYLLAGAGILIMVLAPSAVMLYVIGTIAGLTYKIAMPYNYSHGYEIVPASRMDDAVSITTAVYGFGSFLSTYCAGWLVSGMKAETYVKTWPVWAGVMLLLFVIDLFAIAKERKEG